MGSLFYSAKTLLNVIGDNSKLAIIKKDVLDLNAPNILFFKQLVDINRNIRIFKFHTGR